MSGEYVFWLVWSPSGGPPMVSHATEIEAEKEAKRLARANTGKSFFVLRAVSRFELDSLRETILELAPPF